MFKKALMATAIAMAGSAAHADTLLSENFNLYSSLAGKGWVVKNNSTAGGLADGWFQGDTTFSGQAGGLGSYVGSAWYEAGDVAGSTLADWLISPTFSTSADGSVSFYARADIADGFADHIRYGINSTGSLDVASFAVSPITTLTGEWVQYTLNFSGTGTASTARFAIEYLGSTATSNYIGVDSVLITAVPEPTTYALMGAGLIGLALRRRSVARKTA